MRQFQITQPRFGEFMQVEEPYALPGSAICEPVFIGLCGSDKRLWLGDMVMTLYPRVPGHEVVARVVDLDAYATINPYSNCGHCPACEQKRYNACQNNETMGVQRDGVTRDRFQVYKHKLHFLQEPRPEYVLVEPMSVALHAIARAGEVRDKWCVVIGCGNIGSLLIVALKKKGAHVIAVANSTKAACRANNLGADLVTTSIESPSIYEVRGGDGPHAIFEATHGGCELSSMVQAISYGGKIVLIGHSNEPTILIPTMAIRKELDILGSRNSLNQWVDARCMVAQHMELWPFLIEGIWDRGHIGEAFSAANQPGAGKVIIAWN